MQGVVSRVVEAVGRPCPIPVIEAARALRGLSPGEVLLVRADDPAAEGDLQAFCRATGHRLRGLAWEGAVLSVWVEVVGPGPTRGTA